MYSPVLLPAEGTAGAQVPLALLRTTKWWLLYLQCSCNILQINAWEWNEQVCYMCAWSHLILLTKNIGGRNRQRYELCHEAVFAAGWSENLSFYFSSLWCVPQYNTIVGVGLWDINSVQKKFFRICILITSRYLISEIIHPIDPIRVNYSNYSLYWLHAG